MNEIMGNRYDSDLADKETMGYQMVEDDVPEDRMAEFGDPQFIALEKTDNPKTFTVLSMPAAAPEENMPGPNTVTEVTPGETRDETNERIKNLLGEDMLAGTPPAPANEQNNYPAEPLDASKITDVPETAEQKKTA